MRNPFLKSKDFFSNFYLDKKTTISKCASKALIPQFFFEHAVKEDATELLPANNRTYLNYINGTNPKATVWNLVNEGKHERLENALFESLNPAYLKEILNNFGLTPDEQGELTLACFAHAAAEQFFAIAAGFGDGDDILADLYLEALQNAKAAETSGFKEETVHNRNANFVPATGILAYLETYTNKYRWIHIWGNDYLLEEHYIGNRIGLRKTVFVDPGKNDIENPTLDSIRAFDPSGNTHHTKIIGSSGMGKSFLLRHLFLVAAEQYRETGILPILIDLNDFTEKTEKLTDLLPAELLDKDVDSAVFKYLKEGRCSVLFDGVDEIDISLKDQFQKEMAEFKSAYARSQIVIASRECDAVNSLSGFSVFYLKPFDNEKTEKLILSLLPDEDKEAVKEEVLEYLNKGFIRKDGKVATNPMILSFLVLHHAKIGHEYQQRAKFYRAIYDALLTGHDKNKERFSRSFISVDSPEDFTKVFREFCAKSFLKGVSSFDDATFEEFFESLKTRDELSNPKKCSRRAFQHDVCSTACMMYEENEDLYYIDEAFQEFLFAEHYRFGASEAEAEELVSILNEQTLEDYKDLKAFRLLYDDSPEKVSKNILRPFLKDIFAQKDDETAFAAYLKKGYPKLKGCYLDHNALASYVSKITEGSMSPLHFDNESYVILFRLLQEILGLQTTTYLLLDKMPVTTEFVTSNIIAEQITYNGVDGLLVFKRILSGRETRLVNPVLDEKEMPVIFGVEYEFNTEELTEYSDFYTNFIHLLMEQTDSFYSDYLKIKDFYHETGKRIYRESKKS